MRILFVTWDGPQVNYVESLFVPIFQGMKAHGTHVDILQFRWGTPVQEKQVRSACREAGIGYRAARVRRGARGLAPFVSAFAGGRQVRRAVKAFGSDIIMPRSVLASIPVLRAGGAQLRPIILDADGFAIDERVDFAGLSPKSLTYRILRDVEAQSVREAASVIVRSESAKHVLVSRAGPPVGPERFHVVTNGRDEELFHPGSEASRGAVRDEVGVGASAPLLVYAGSVGPQYRFDLIGALAAELHRRRPDTRLLVLSGSPEEARAALSETSPGVLGYTTIMRSAPHDVPRYLAAADIGAAFRTPSFSTQGVAPVKLSEYLLCGLPVVGTAAIGDTSAAREAGVFFDDTAGCVRAADWVIEKVLADRDPMRLAARRVGVERFSLRRSIQDYLAAVQPVLALAKT